MNHEAHEEHEEETMGFFGNWFVVSDYDYVCYAFVKNILPARVLFPS
ncbi:hypothetical protein IIA29_10480 [candidate division KSB1 bacterium]|nr:hypothetical protein [candidate division KSB1 bacterium]